MIRKRLFCLQLTLILFTSACLLPLAANARDIYSDTWVAADGLDRILPTAKEAGAVKENKYVGIFYFLFMNSDDIHDYRPFQSIPEGRHRGGMGGPGAERNACLGRAVLRIL